MSQDAISSFPWISQETRDRLAMLVAQVETWQKKTNLIAPSTLEDIWQRHVADSLQCVALKPEARVWLDLGSGGGFPGLVIGAVLAEQPGGQITLVESNQKKCAFLRQAARAMEAPVTVLCERIERVGWIEPFPDVVTARALAGLPQLLTLASPWLEEGATGLFHKGREYTGEVAECDGLWQFDLVHHESRTAPDSVLLEITQLTSARS